MSSQPIVPSTSRLLWMSFSVIFLGCLAECQGIIQQRGRAGNPRLPSHWSLTSDVFCSEVCAGYECSDVQGHREPHRRNLYAYSAYCETISEPARKYPVEYTLLLFSDQTTNLICTCKT